MRTSSRPDDAHPYLRAASAGVRHHARVLARTVQPAESRTAVDRAHLDVLHAHLTQVHQLLDQLSDAVRPPHPAAGRHLASARTRLWQAIAEVHSAFHLLPTTSRDRTNASECHPDRLPAPPRRRAQRAPQDHPHRPQQSAPRAHHRVRLVSGARRREGPR
ncbi:hypothetical protein GCM10010222_75350 [Streptomyces tanashiensis]|nr:hypothetical protein GCM10010222_75350 [Streptomyces tanashiensis]